MKNVNWKTPYIIFKEDYEPIPVHRTFQPKKSQLIKIKKKLQLYCNFFKYQINRITQGKMQYYI